MSSNYRPVSNLHFVSKLVERTVVHQLCNHMNIGFPLPSCQSAYRAGHSTETDLSKVKSDFYCKNGKPKGDTAHIKPPAYYLTFQLPLTQ